MKPHHRIFFMQFAMAFALGALLARLPDLQSRFGIGEGQVGLLLLTMASGTLCSMSVCMTIIERLGARTTAFVSIFGAATIYALIPWMSSTLAAAPLFFVAGLCTGAFEINANIEADRHEALLGHRIMSRAHGLWSLGMFLTALIAAFMRQAGIALELHALGVFIAVIIAGTLVLSGVRNAPRRPGSVDGQTPLVALPTLGLLPLCLIGGAPLFAEGAGVDWSTIYMRDVFAAEPFVGGLSVTLFSLLIALARLGMDPVVDRFGPRPVAIVLLSVAALGLVTVASAPHPGVALLGFALMGVGCSSVYPLAVSAAAQRTDRPSSVNVAALGQMTFFVFFAGPPLLGFAAEHFGIRVSYWIVVPFVFMALLATRALEPQSQAVEARG